VRSVQLFQVRGDATSGSVVRPSGPDSRRDPGVARVSSDRQTDRGARGSVGLCRVEHEAACRDEFTLIESTKSQGGWTFARYAARNENGVLVSSTRRITG